MSSLLRRPGLWLGLIAVVLASAGVAAGAAHLIDGHNLEPGSVSASKLTASARKSLKGATGKTGSEGETGAAGPAGAIGPQGLAGAIGPQGLAGAKGDTGDKGDKGDMGDMGDKGDKGDKGDHGDIGPAGPGALPIAYDNTSPPLSATSPTGTTVATAGPITLRMACWLDSDGDTESNLTYTSTVSVALDDFYTNAVDTDGSGQIVDTTYISGGGTGPLSINLWPATTTQTARNLVDVTMSYATSAGPQVYTLHVVDLTNGHAGARECRLAGYVVPATT